MIVSYVLRLHIHHVHHRHARVHERNRGGDVRVHVNDPPTAREEQRVGDHIDRVRQAARRVVRRGDVHLVECAICLLYTSPSPRDS